MTTRHRHEPEVPEQIGYQAGAMIYSASIFYYYLEWGRVKIHKNIKGFLKCSSKDYVTLASRALIAVVRISHARFS